MKASWKYTGQGPCFAQGRSCHRPTTRWLGIVCSAGLAAVLAACSVAGVPSTGKVQRQEGAISFNDAARFLDQATFGATLSDIQHVQDIGYSAWIDEQFAMGISNYPNVCCSGAVVTCSPVIECQPGDVEAYPNNAPAGCGAGTACGRDNYTMWQLQNIFYQNALGAPDQLRQRIFFALNQILVTSGQDAMINRTHQMSPYLRVLEQNALGNFHDVLQDISLNGTMGRYLDNIDNTASQLNENYAREIMQLFSVGLFILNDDGTSTGNPTYDQPGVVELTRALTGWQLAAQFSAGVPNYRDPLRPKAAAQHDSGSKTLFVNTPYAQTIPAGGTAQTDLEAAINIIFNHPNVGTFIGKGLIQMLVTSNPSGDYVRRVTQAFNNNGSGVRGDMQAVVRAILLDPEARNPSPNATFGKLKEPVLQVTNLMRALRGGFSTDYGLSDFSLVGLNGSFNTAYLARGEDVFRSPTVFNFFPPDFPLPGDTTGLVGPEFGILSTTTALGAINLTYRLVVTDLPQVLTPYPYRPNGTQFDPTTLDGSDPNALVENLNQILLHGSMTDDLRNLVVNQVSGVSDVNQRVRQAVFLIASSPAYQVQR